ncbi:NAD-glutamate dehydrogenase [Teredinibacter turnerae]|uniref:NAD-glutamate dehydrogenase n=1 Tax=Teredinibacter turnerae TaxID=2426 RepID=UPI00041936A2|nr:NAD-glutamate dehydrogenase [Teredinibacter turnerae]
MEISQPHVNDREHFLTVFDKWVEQNKQKETDPGFLKFAQVYLARFPLEDWVGRQIGDLFGLCYGLFMTLKNSARKPVVEVYNPSLSEHGWQSGRTIVVILQRDMPFLVDSIRVLFNKKEIPIYIIKSRVLNVKRGGEFSVEQGGAKPSKEKNISREALIYLEISLHPASDELVRIKRELQKVLADVSAVVDDHDSILARLDEAQGSISQMGESTAEIVAFLSWLRHRHFVFLGFRDYNLIDEADGRVLEENPDARMGVFRGIKAENTRVPEAQFSDGIRNFYEGSDIVCFSKAATHSSVHRAVYPDYVVVKKLDAEGKALGEVRFLGLFTYEVFSQSPFDIPILRLKVNSIVENSGLDPNSHDGKNLFRTIENYPRTELMLTDTATLENNILAIANLNERHLVKLIARADPFGNFVTCNVFVPRDVYTSASRQRIQDILGEALGSNDFDFNTFFSESNLVRAQFVFRIDPSVKRELNLAELEDSIAEVTRNWTDHLRSSLYEEYGEAKGTAYFNAFKNGFTPSYQEYFDARFAVQDIKLIEELKNEQDIAMNFYRPFGADETAIRFRILHLNEPLVLSDVIPLLENLGLRVIGEHPYQIFQKNGKGVWLHDFQLVLGLPVNPDISSAKLLFEDAFEAIWRGQAESDPFNKLVLAARLNWREVCVLRAYAGYMKQVGFSSDQAFVADTLLRYLDITRDLVAIFKSRFDPRLNRDNKSKERGERLKKKVLDALDAVPNLNEDLVLRHYLQLIDGTLRTNYFRANRDYISFKFSPRTIPDIPEPRPLFEIYVYSPRVEGVHLRGGKVARGGLRWSDRLQDYRTEVLGLVKAQQVKNAVIVPTGAKGGFVSKNPPKTGGRKAVLDEGIACYKTFIRGLLDLTDNFVAGEVIPPPEVIRHDEDDPYLVVAADKGTATFSDIANAISIEYSHWLGDAFASGGSQGYDHKGMGITARGAWVSVQRHFREKGIDIQKEDFSVIGIGDMAGDVFGNGMLLSEHICLTAAFNHMHIFIDPTPNAAATFTERQRLFQTPGITWDDFDKSLISAGGGVFSRADKYIAISPQMREVFAITADKLTPTQLINALLKAPVDLIWNGGIGTYVKASIETHTDVGDKANDAVRVNGLELRCQVFGEGGNLGMTQLGRVEYALSGGACNTDFIDNAAGVDCSDHEVNIKILLDEMVAAGDLTAKQRNALLVEMTDDVAELVLQNNYRQTQALSIAQFHAATRDNEYRRFITFLENRGRLDRSLEFIPTDEQIAERQAHGKVLTRPELSVLISYAKVMLKEELTDSDLAEDPYIARAIESAFPQTIVHKFPEELYRHRLKKEIVGTQLANDLINNLGITVGHRLLETTGARSDQIARAYVVSRDVFEFEEFQDYIKSLDNKVSAEFQAELTSNMIRRVRRGTRWFLRNRRQDLSPEADVAFFKESLDAVYAASAEAIEGSAREEWLARSKRFEELALPGVWALRLAMPDNLFSGLGVVESARMAGKDIRPVTDMFFDLLDKLDLNWFASQLSEIKVDTYWQAIARETYLDDLETALRRLTVAMVNAQDKSGAAGLFEQWLGDNASLIVRWKQMITEVQASPGTDYAMFAVALRELGDLVDVTEHWV